MKHIQAMAIGICVMAAVFAFVWVLVNPSWIAVAVLAPTVCYVIGRTVLDFRESSRQIRRYRQRPQRLG